MKLGYWTQFVAVAVALVVVDLPWLTMISGDYMRAVQQIQCGKEVRTRPIAGAIVYPALAYLSLKTKSLNEAFLTGMAVYAVYDFTVLAVFEKYPLYLAVADSLWGGTLFSIVYYLRSRFLESF